MEELQEGTGGERGRKVNAHSEGGGGEWMHEEEE